MKHKRKYSTLLELVSHIKIEEQNRTQAKGKYVDHSSSAANLVESKNVGKGSKGKGPISCMVQVRIITSKEDSSREIA